MSGNGVYGFRLHCDVARVFVQRSRAVLQPLLWHWGQKTSLTFNEIRAHINTRYFISCSLLCSYFLSFKHSAATLLGTPAQLPVNTNT